MKFDINNYKGKCVMHCKTEAEAKAFCDYLHSIGRTWQNGDSYTKNTNWDEDAKSVCYNFNHGLAGSKGFYREKKYTILEFADFIWSTEFTKADLKDGMILKSRKGKKWLVLNGKWVGEDSYMLPCDFTEDLRELDCPEDTIDVIYISNACELSDLFDDDYLTCIWERKAKPEPVEMTIEEICKALGKEIKIVKG